MAILLPALAHFRTEGYITATTEELTSVKSACLAYYAHFNAYPGFFSEADISNGSVSATGQTPPLSGTQNMLLSLMGTVYTSTTGLTSYSTVTDGANPPLYVPFTLGTGPIDYANNNQQLNSFYSPAQAVLQTQPPTTGSASPTALPVLYDEFPSGIPILYYRRNPGQPGSGGVPVGTNQTTTADAAFWLNCNVDYFHTTTLHAINGIIYDELTLSSTHYSSYNDTTNGPDALAAMVVNQTLATNYATAPNTVAYPVQGDFALDSAGPDHAYGPAVPSSSSNWGTSAGQCDDIFVFGGQ